MRARFADQSLSSLESSYKTTSSSDSFDLSSFLPKKNKAVAKPLGQTTQSPVASSSQPLNESTAQQTFTSQQEGRVFNVSRKDELLSNTTESRADVYAEEENEQEERLPILRKAELKGHERAVTALTIDPSGTRMLSGGYDYKVRFWDFNGMDQGLHSFREVEPWDGYQVKDVHFSNSGDLFLVATGANRAKIYNRDGFQQHEYMKGDPYIMDMKHTKGHIAPLTCCQWHPTDRQVFLTAAGDSTIRIWDVENVRFQSYTVIAKSNQPGRLTAAVTSASFNTDGKMVAGGRQDGAISMWNYTSPNLRPILHVPDAHQSGTEISRINFSKDDLSMASRGCDGTLKLWDLRMFKKPVNVVNDLENIFPETDAIFSPHGKFIITGTSAKKGQGVGKLLFYDRFTLEKKHEIGLSLIPYILRLTAARVDVAQSSVIRIVWHEALDQIFVGCSDNSIYGYFDPDISKKGLLLSMAKKAKKRVVQTYIPESSIHLPNALLVDDEEEQQQGRGYLRKDNFASRAVEVAYNMYTPRGETELLKQVTAASGQHQRDEDPREALLKHAKEAEENPMWVGHVYKKTQPKPIFDYTRDELDEQRNVKRRK